MKYCQFYTFCKRYSKAKWLQNGRFWERSSDQPTRWLIRLHVKETGTSKWREHCHVFIWPYAIHFIPTNMVGTRVGGNLRIRKENTKTTVPLDVVPKRRTELPTILHLNVWICPLAACRTGEGYRSIEAFKCYYGSLLTLSFRRSTASLIWCRRSAKAQSQ